MKPRLHVLLARGGKTGVVLRRGPSKQVASIRWDRKRDTFTLGQWLEGRIYERRSDLTPDGEHMIYFAMHGAKGAWTAISRAPYLSAIALFAKGDCWHGGGLFLDDRTYWLNDGRGHEVIAETSRVKRAPREAVSLTYGAECMGVYVPRLVRDGWTLRDDVEPDEHPPKKLRRHTIAVLDRPLDHGWVLRKLARGQIHPSPGRGVYFDEHALVHPARDLVVMRRDWEWADVERGRLVWSAGGALWAGAITARSAKRDEPLATTTMLHDFSGMTFEAVAAPYAPIRNRR